MSITKRLIILLALPLACLAALAVHSLVTTMSLERETRRLADLQIQSLVTVGRISREISSRRINLRNCIISQDPTECARARTAFVQGDEALTRLFSAYSANLVSDEADELLYREVRQRSETLGRVADSLLADLDSGKRDVAISRLAAELVPLGQELDEQTDRWSQHNAQLGYDAGAKILESFERSRRNSIVVGALGFLITGFVGVAVARSVTRTLNGLSRSVQTIAGGNLETAVPFTDRRDGVGALARSIDVLRVGAAAAEEQRWVKTHVARVAGVLQGLGSPEEFGGKLLAEVMALLGDGVSALYVADAERRELHRVASFGLATGPNAAAVRFGEGLVGQCAADRVRVAVNDLPPEYLRISSGLGSAPPRYTAAWPLNVQGSAVAVLEVASFSELKPLQQSLLSELLPVAGVSLDLLMQSLRTQRLLRDTSRQAEELRSQQEALRASEDQFRTLLEATPDALVISDADGKVVLINAQAERLLGYTRQELVGSSIDILVPPRFRAQHPERRRSYHASAAVRPMGSGMELAAVRKDGSEFSVEISLSPIHRHDGQGTWVCSSIRDITERKRAEADLRIAKQKAEEATAAKGAFLANMSHEIRTPMNGIMGMTELALDTDLTAEQRDYLSTVKSSADALLSLINDILDFSKIEAGRIELDPIDFPLRDSLADTLSPLALRASTKGVELAYDVHPEVPDALVGDVYRLRQIIVNLVGNAIKFTEKGEVVLAVRLLERAGDALTIEFAVRDTGIGIDAGAASRLFRPFEQAETSTTRKYGGTGLGLAISRQLAELMGGQIRLESTPGAGSTFSFSARFKAGTPSPVSSAEDATRVLQGKTALIVDDNATNRQIVQTMLGHWGLRSIQVDSAKAALTALDRAANAGQPVSMVITDLHMPEMDGFELVEAIRRHPSFKSLPVMLLTSSAAVGDQARCTELGVAAKLLKPVKQSLLLDNVLRVMVGADRRDKVAAPARAAEPAQATSSDRPLKILLAEDNPVNQKFALRVLEGAGHGVTVATNGLEAVEKSAKDAFDLILMDVQMPTMDGLDATRAIRAREAGSGKAVPIVAMTANAMKGDRETCLDAGMTGYVPKPVKKETLFAEMARVLKGPSNGDHV